MRCTASAATSAGPTTRPIGSVARSSSRRASSSSPRSDADSGVSTKPAAIRLTRTGASSSARFAVSAGSAAVAAETSPRPTAGLRPPVPPMNSSVPPGRTLAAPLRATPSHQHGCSLEPAARLVEVHLGQRRVVRAAGGDQHVVDRARQPAKNASSAAESVASKAARAPRADSPAALLQPLGIAAGEDDVGALGAGAAGRLEPDAGAAADHDDGLPAQLRLAGHSCSPPVRPPSAGRRRPACAAPRSPAQRLQRRDVDLREGRERLDRVAQHVERDVRADGQRRLLQPLARLGPERVGAGQPLAVAEQRQEAVATRRRRACRWRSSAPPTAARWR